MKRLLLITLFFLFSISSFGQKIRFSDTSNKWNCYLLGLELEPPIVVSTNFLYNGTISFHDTVYEKLCQSGLGCIGYIREDTIDRKVYGIYLSPIASVETAIDSTEYVLYDYNLHIGDTFKRPYTVNHYVASMDSVLINSVWHKTWYLVPTTYDSAIGQGAQDNYYVIEGIGSLSYPFFPADPTSFETAYSLTCFSTGDTTPPLSKRVGSLFDNAASCSLTFGLEVKNIDSKNGIVTLSPNPTTSEFTVTSSDNINSIIISNLIGQAIYSQHYNARQVQVDVADLPGGMYLVKINGTEVRKFVKE